MGRALRLLLEPLLAASQLKVAFQLFFQRMQDARHRHQHRDAFILDGADDLCRIQGLLKVNRSRNQLWDENSQKLPEDMNQRQQVEKANGMEYALILQIFFDLRFEGFEIGKNIAVGDDHAFGLCRGP